MDVRVLGPVTARGVRLSGREAAVLSLLAAEAPSAVSTTELATGVWGEDPPRTAHKSLQNAVSALRRVLGDDAIETTAGGYRYALAPETVDFHRLSSDDLDAEEALALFQGEPFADLADHPAAVARRTAVAERRNALEDLAAERLIAAGRAADAVARLEEGVAAEPYRERRWALLVRALAAEGRQADALRAAQRARTRLADDLGLDPGAELAAAERSVFDAPALGAPSVPTPATSFIGRAEELRVTRKRLLEQRLVTLTGPGGAGKTRLSLAVAAEHSAPVLGFVDLAAVHAPAIAWSAAAAALAVRSEPDRPLSDVVVSALRTRPGLVVLDNCEHLLDAAADIAGALVERCPGVRVLATSREPLGLAGEAVVALPPLEAEDARRLFLDRAREVGAEESDAAAVDELCARLDRLPLAIELAAARSPALSASQLLERLANRFDLLDERARRGAPRHRALRAVVDWSYDLLDPDEQLLFDRMSVFRGGVRLEDVEAVAGDERLPADRVAGALTRLVRASLVSVEPGTSGSRRYRLLETFRAYGEARLAERDEQPDLSARHLAWIAGVAAEAAHGLAGPDQTAWFARIGELFDDVQAALAWCDRHGDSGDGLLIANSLFQFWMGRARRAEGLGWIEHFSERAQGVPALDRCRALHGAVMMSLLADVTVVERLAATAHRIADDRDSRALAQACEAAAAVFRGDNERAWRLAEEMMPVLAEPQHGGSLARLWDPRAWVLAARGDFAAARRQLAPAVAELAAMGDRHLHGAWVALDADLAVAAGDDDAEELARAALGMAVEVQCPSCQSMSLTTLACAAWPGGAADVGGPQGALREAVRLAARVGETSGLVYTVSPLAAVVADEAPALAAKLAAGAAAVRARRGHVYSMAGRLAFAGPLLERARAKDPEAWDAAAAESADMTYDELVALALTA